MKKFLKIVAGILVVLVVAAGVGLWAFSNSRHAAASAEAIAALTSDGTVTVAEDRYWVYRPTSGTPKMGVVFYPGASCDVRGYAPLLRRIAEAGYLVVAVPMPLEFAVLAPNRALEVQAAHPEIERWAMIGHSLGGAMASMFIYNHPDKIDGLVIWDSYPADNNSLASWQHPVWTIHRAKPDGTPSKVFSERAGLLPKDAHWVPVPGGIHMFFGSFDGGAFVEEWEPSIPREQAQDIIVAGTLEGLAAMGGPS